MNGLALCAGIGGIDLGLKLAIGDEYRTVCYVEREAYAVAVLAEKMEKKELDEAPIWDDIGTFDGTAWRGLVDIITAGFPCQPHSIAGKRAGTADERWIWPTIARIIREVGPNYVFLENVPGLLKSGGFEVCIADLANMGYNTEWGVLSASEVGAPHLRKRLWMLSANSNSGRFKKQRINATNNFIPSDGANANGCSSSSPSVGNANESGLQRNWSQGTTWDTSKGHPEPAVFGMANGIPNRVDRLRAIGNAVVPQCAAHAFQILMERLKDS